MVRLRICSVCTLFSLCVVGLFYVSQFAWTNKVRPIAGLSVVLTKDTTKNISPARRNLKPTPLTVSPEQQKLVTKLILTNKKIVDRVRKICHTHKQEVTSTYMDYNTQLGITYWLWMVFPRHDLFYCALPKCGSTTWKSYLLEDSGLDWEGLDTHEAAKEFGAFKLLEKYVIDPIEFLQNVTQENRLMIVRNPWSRLVSAYHDKIQRQNWPLKKLCTGWRKYRKISQNQITFPMFIDCVLNKPPGIHKESHTHPMADLCGVCHTDYNIIIRLEELRMNEQFLMSHLKFKNIPKYAPPTVVNKTSNYQEYYNQLDSDTINNIYETYKWDLEMFGYPRSPFDAQ